MIENQILYSNNSQYFSNNIFSYITKANPLYNSDDTLLKLLSSKRIDKNTLAFCNQIHSDKVFYIKKPGEYAQSDGLVAKCSNNVVLKIQTADCVPVSMYDPDKQLIGLVHSGWKGTKNSICNNAIEIFIENGSNPNNIKVFLGPSIQKCCYEVKSDVSEQFNEKYIIKINDKQFLDMQSKIKDDLILNGIYKNNISISDICTHENEGCYSYRKEGESAGRMYTILGITNESI